MAKLVLIGGPPGVGKTTVLEELLRVCSPCACLDADDVWRVQPVHVNEEHRAIADANVAGVLRGYLEAGYPLVFLAWVLADPKKVERILADLEGHYDSALVLYLVAERETLRERARAKFERGLDPDYQLMKLRQIEALPSAKIDTTDLDSGGVASEICRLVRGH